MNKLKHSWIQSPCTLTPAGGTWKEQCINIQYLVPTSAWVTHKGNRDPMELHNNRVSRRSNKKKWKTYAKLLQVRYALFKEVQICKVILKVTLLLSNEQKKMTKKNIKGRKKSAVNLKLQNISMFINRQFWWEKTFYAVRQFSNAFVGFSLSISVSQILLWKLLLTYLIFLHISNSTCLSSHPSSPTSTNHLTYSYKRNKAMTYPLHPCLPC